MSDAVTHACAGTGAAAYTRRRYGAVTKIAQADMSGKIMALGWKTAKCRS